MTTFDRDLAELIESAAEFGITAEQVMGWTRDDLIRFGDLLNARLAADQAELDLMREVHRERFGSDGRT